MDFNIKIIFDRRKTATLSNPGTVEIEVTQVHPYARKRFSTHVRVLKNQWRDGMVVGRSDSPDLNIKIQEKYREIYDDLTKRGSLNNYNPKIKYVTFADWLESQIASRSELAPQTRRQHLTMLSSVRNFGRLKTFADLTVENIMLWDSHIRQHVRKQSAIHDYHKRLKVYVNRALQYGMIAESPYSKLKISRGVSNSIKYLTDDERRRLASLELKGGMAIARDMFMLACYTGLAYCDLVKIRKENIVEEDGRSFIIDHRQKTSSPYRLMIMPKAKEILRRYDYNMDLMSNQKCNVYLKAIAVLADIHLNLTFHVGRHTFATWALKHGVSIEVVSKMLAHADIGTTQIYAKVLQSEVTTGFQKLVDSE